jgi:hypothetical protein
VCRSGSGRLNAVLDLVHFSLTLEGMAIIKIYRHLLGYRNDESSIYVVT